jgi:hypothetical protein
MLRGKGKEVYDVPKRSKRNSDLNNVYETADGGHCNCVQVASQASELRPQSK